MITCAVRHEFVNEVQVTAQVFFPGEKFSFADTIAETGYSVESVLEAHGAVGFVYKDGVEIARHFFEFVPDVNYLNERRAVMLALFCALRKVFSVETPWGALTGIRPSKLVREWMDENCTNAEILSRLTNTFCVSEEKARLALEVAHAENRVFREIETRGGNATRPIGVYVSVPFCPSRCVYCSFNTAHKPATDDFLARYVAALIRECRQKSQRASEMGAAVSSVYIGGGTPTVLNAEQLERLLDAVCENFADIFCAPPVEFTVEAGRPETLSVEKLKLLKRYGVNRLAVNPQTLNDKTLAAIGRDHTAADFFAAFHRAREIGFPCINTDLIAGLPNETPDDMRRNMDALSRLALPPENITIHTLALKRASKLNELRLSAQAPPAEELPPSAPPKEKSRRGEVPPRAVGASALVVVPEMLAIAERYCAEMGLRPYYLYRQKNMAALHENIGYSLPTHECLYNVGMMAEVQTILGIGAGAVSKFVDGNKITREFNAKNSEIYLARV
ncbi:MAG: coproporphyrinogen dehydrogenase HemZ [Defluviitaleaceae bacterium]|nr:coproporphyrinogen dehydrogenase HemZ [Defluviitaleaceae bacterium]MCL2264014.1 coproporphyrinogen dehydrogenase HemZ [Defluviitaleaceae bacterium]